MSEAKAKEQTINLKSNINDILSIIDQEREREIITRRFGLFDRRETLEQIGELLGITRERVRQLEKAILSKLKNATESGKVATVNNIEKVLIRELTEMGRVAKISDLTDKLLGGTSSQNDRARVAFIAELAPGLSVVDQNDNYYHSVGIREYGDEKNIRDEVDKIVSAIKKHGEPLTI
jgi:DNA-binding CsgD family transcriptional regulator